MIHPYDRCIPIRTAYNANHFRGPKCVSIFILDFLAEIALLFWHVTITLFDMICNGNLKLFGSAR